MLRTIRSYVRRTGRITSKQANALATDLSLYGVRISTNILINPEQIFGRSAPKILEIGFGMGHSLVQMAETHPEADFLGIEVHRPGLGSLISLAKEHRLSNLKAIEGDAVSILKENIPDLSLDKIQIFFPDPWPKKRHHKRRLIQADFLALVCAKLKPGAYLHLATDWQEYAHQMMELLTQQAELKNTAGCGIYAINTDRPLTKFERRGVNLGHSIWDLLFVKV